MELIEGKTLRDVIHEEAPLTARESLAILEPILLALRAAHAAGMIHRDVKPENVIVRRDGEVKVADFGLARAITTRPRPARPASCWAPSPTSPPSRSNGAWPTREATCMPRACSSSRCYRAQGRHRRDAHPDRVQPRPRRGRRPVDARAEIPAALDDLVARATALEPGRPLRVGDGLPHGPARGPARPVRGRARPSRRRRARPDSTSALAPTSATTRLPAADRTAAPARPARPALARRPPHAPQRARSSRPRWSARPDDGPLLEHTAAMPIDRHQRSDARRALATVDHGGPHRCRRRARRLVVHGRPGWLDHRAGGRRPTGLAGRRRDAAGLPLCRDHRRVFSEVKPRASSCASSRPQAASSAKRSTVRLVVSKGQERYAVPNLVGLKAETSGRRSRH